MEQPAITLAPRQTSPLAGRLHRVRRWSATLAEFVLVQGVVQLMTALAGLVILRALPKSEYALFAIANAMQVTCNTLADVGIGIGMRSLGSQVWNDRARFGALVNTVLGLRRQFAAVSFAACLPLGAWMLWRNGAGLATGAYICLAVAAGVLPLLGTTAWLASAQLHSEYRRIQKLDSANAALRLALACALALSRINALLAVLLGTVGNWVQSIFLRRWAREKLEIEAPANASDRHEILRLSKKSLPNTLFFCFQGQVTLLILTLMGSPVGVADLTALGRLAILFTIFSVTFANVLGPAFARCQDPARLARIYLMFAGGSMLVLAPLAALAWNFPRPFLWLLGAQYGALGRECGWVVAAGCIAQVAGVMWNLNSSKAWIRIQAVWYIPTLLLVQSVTAFSLDLRQFHYVLIFNLATAAAPVPLLVADAVIGLAQREHSKQTNPATRNHAQPDCDRSRSKVGSVPEGHSTIA